MSHKDAQSGIARTWRFLTHPVVGFASAVVGVLSLVLSIAFFVAGHETRDLSYTVHPARAAVVRADQTSKLTIEFVGEPLTGDITAAQIAFWNSGDLPIRASHVLQPMVIRTSNNERILDVSVRKASRSVLGLKLVTDRLDVGEVGIEWDIMEHDDGAVLQLIHSGDESVDFEFLGVLEGQPVVSRVDFAIELRSLDEQYSRQLRERRTGGWALVLSGILVPFGVLLGRWAERKLPELLSEHTSTGQIVKWEVWTARILAALAGVVLTGIGIWILAVQRSPGPPFGF